jgi:hypothetical protein
MSVISKIPKKKTKRWVACILLPLYYIYFLTQIGQMR